MKMDMDMEITIAICALIAEQLPSWFQMAN